MGCASCKSNSCKGTCGNEISRYLTSSLTYDGARFICQDSQSNTLFEIQPCTSMNDLLTILFEQLCTGLNTINNAVANVGTGVEWYQGFSSGSHNFRTLLTDPGFTATQNANDITIGINFISSDASVTIQVVGNDIDLVAVNQSSVQNVGVGTGEVYQGLSGGFHNMRTLLESKWIKIDTVGSDVEIRGKRIGNRETTFDDGGTAEFFTYVETTFTHQGSLAYTDLGSELSIVPLSEFVCLVTAYLKCSINMVSTDTGYFAIKFELPDDIKLNTGGATQITNDYLQNNLATCYYDLQSYDPTTDVAKRHTNKYLAEAIAYYDDGLGTNEAFPMGTTAGNFLAIRYVPYNGVPGLYYFNARVTIPIKLDSDWDYLESISVNYERNW